MNKPITITATSVAAALLVLACMVWPAIAFVSKCITQGAIPAEGFFLSGRQWGLIWRSVWLSIVATMACLALSGFASYALCRLGRISRRPVVVATLFGLVLIPLTVSAFGWERADLLGFSANERCILIWAFWAWPVPSLLIWARWSQSGQATFDAARLHASSWRAFLLVMVPTLLPTASFCALVLFVFFFSDYAVPHATNVMVASTELLSWASGSSHAIDTLWPSIPVVIIVCVSLAMIRFVWRRDLQPDADRGLRRALPEKQQSLALGVIAVLVASSLFPIIFMAWKVLSLDVFVEAVSFYSRDLAWSLGVALISGILVVGMGVAALTWRRFRIPVFYLSIIIGALPGAIVGEALTAAYALPVFSCVYDHWPIVVFAYIARFGWVGIALVLVLDSDVDPDIARQARSDGAGEFATIQYIRIPTNLAAMFAGVGVVAAHSLGELSAVSLVRVPAFAPISQVIVDKFHFFEDGLLISLCVIVCLCALPPVVLVLFAWRGRSR